jgi:hypothetical protein
MMLVTEGRTEVAELPGAGLIACSYYDPYPPRFATNLKGLLDESRPMLMRVHPGVRYEMSDDELFTRADVEGHVVAVVGYNQERRTLLVADPWERARPDHPHAAIVEETEEEGTGTVVVDCTLDFTTTPMPLPVSISIVSTDVDRVLVVATLSLTQRGHLKPAVSLLDHVQVSIALPAGLELEDGGPRRAIGSLGTGDSSTVEWRVRQTGPVDGQLSVAVASLAVGCEPYEFRDVVGGQASLAVRSVATSPERTFAA